MRQSNARQTKTGKTFTDRPFFKNLTVILGITGTTVGLLTAVEGLLSSHPSGQNIEIILDGSDAMNKRLAKESITKLQAAAGALHKVGFSEDDNVAVRQSGGECADDAVGPNMPFQRGAKTRLPAALQSIHPEGDNGLATAVVASISDVDLAAKSKDVTRRLVVITGGGEGCQPDPQEAIAVRLRMRGKASQNDVDFHFIGLGLSESGKRSLQDMSRAANGTVDFANSQAELETILQRRVVVGAVDDDIRRIITALDQCSEDLTHGFDELKHHRGADADLKAARLEFQKTALPLADLRTRESKSDFRTMYRLAAESRDTHERLLTLMSEMISKSDAAGRDEYKALVQEFTDLSDYYRRTVGQIRDARKGLVLLSLR